MTSRYVCSEYSRCRGAVQAGEDHSAIVLTPMNQHNGATQDFTSRYPRHLLGVLALDKGAIARDRLSATKPNQTSGYLAIWLTIFLVWCLNYIGYVDALRLGAKDNPSYHYLDF